jgi:hypothetical protein
MTKTDDRNKQPDLLALARAHDAAVLALELQAARALSGPLRARLVVLARTVRSQWPSRTGAAATPVDAALRARAVDEMRAVAVQVDASQIEAAVIRAANRASLLGDTHANAQVALQKFGPPSPFVRIAEAAGAPAPAAMGPATELQKPVRAVAGAAGDTATVHLQDAAKALAAAETPAEAQAAVAAAGQAAEALDVAMAWAVNRAANDAVRAHAARLGAKTMWVAERDACVVCLALSGHLADPNQGEGFDEEATFGKPGSAPPVWPPGHPLTAPPRHPRCRCHLVVWLGSAPGQPNLPSTLRHEARRSILRGFSRPSEPHRIRVAAAGRLLDTGAADMPKSVRAYAATAVAVGRFPTRDVPHWPSSQPRKAAP